MSKKEDLKKILLLVSPILLFAILFFPYGYLNGHVLVDWLGCGCEQIDAHGNIVTPVFNANDFSALFWLTVSVCATVLAIIFSKKIPRSKIWLRILYIVGIAVCSLLISLHFYRTMLWD